MTYPKIKIRKVFPAKWFGFVRPALYEATLDFPQYPRKDEPHFLYVGEAYRDPIKAVERAVLWLLSDYVQDDHSTKTNTKV